MFKQVKTYIARHKFEIIILIVILLAASFLRLYKISDYMTFLGDEGRDAIVAKDILHGHLTLLGPRASAGDFFLGPIYYYMMAPFLLLTNFDPVGPAIMIALFGIATVFLVYYVGLKFFNARAGLTAAALYAISPLVIAYSRSSWNPNPMPFFSLLMLYYLYLAVKNQSKKIFIVVGLLLGIAMQLHYLTTFLAVIIFFFVLLGEPLIERKKLITKYAIHYVGIFGGFLVTFLPFLAFEARHGFVNTLTILKFIFTDNTTKSYIPHHSFIGNLTDVFLRIFGRLTTNFPSSDFLKTYSQNELLIWQLLTVILAGCSIAALFYAKGRLKILLLMLWLFLGVFLFGIYKKDIYDYYLGFLFPLPFLLIGNLLSTLSEKLHPKNFGLLLGFGILSILILVNLLGFPFRSPGNRQKDQAKNIAEYVLSKTGGQPFNFALMTDGNSDHLYRYFFDVENRSPVTILNTTIDPERKSVTSQLMIVCEKKVCQPLGYSLWEVAGFGRAEIAGEWDVPPVKILRLVHYEEKK